MPGLERWRVGRWVRAFVQDPLVPNDPPLLRDRAVGVHLIDPGERDAQSAPQEVVRAVVAEENSAALGILPELVHRLWEVLPGRRMGHGGDSGAAVAVVAGQDSLVRHGPSVFQQVGVQRFVQTGVRESGEVISQFLAAD